MCKIFYTEDMAKTIITLGTTVQDTTTALLSSSNQPTPSPNGHGSSGAVDNEAPLASDDNDCDFQVVVSKTKQTKAQNALCREKKGKEAFIREARVRRYEERKQKREAEEPLMELSWWKYPKKQD
jgi:hypothetical protein